VAPRRIGELLVAEGLITEAAISRALGYQRVSGDRVKLGSILLGWDLLGEDALLAGLGKLHRCPIVSWETLFATPVEVVRLLPGPQAIRIGAIPYGADKGVIRVAFTNPSNLAATDEVAALTGRRVLPGVATEARMLQAHQKFYGRHIPLEYRPILSKLTRRTTTTSVKPALDFRQTDIVATERMSTEVPRVSSEAAAPVAIPVEPASTDTPHPEISGDQPLAIPEFPIPTIASPATPAPPTLVSERPAEAPPSPWAGTTSLRTGDDSLTEWVGRALSSFTGDAPDVAEAADVADDESPAGVADPSLYGREADERTDAPGALDAFGDALPPTNAFRPRSGEDVRSSRPDVPSAVHSLGIPSSIPPFRRSTDPRIPLEPISPMDREDDMVAGMWQPAPESSRDAAPPALRPEPEPATPASSPSIADRVDASADTTSAVRSRDEIADSVLQGALEQLPRVLLLGAGKTVVTGWRGRGPGLTPETVSAIRIPNSEISVFSSVQQSGVPHFGAIDRAEWPRGLAALFGTAPPDCAIFPIRLLDGVAAFLYADRLGGPMQYEDFAIVARAAASAANVLSRFLLRSEKSERPSSSVRL
jgi:hypothetical protein